MESIGFFDFGENFDGINTTKIIKNVYCGSFGASTWAELFEKGE